MLIVKNNDFFEYEHPESVLVIPITLFVRKDGELVFVHPIAKQAAERVPNLAKVWGYTVGQDGIEVPIYRTSEFCYIGLADRKHYASNEDMEMVERTAAFVEARASESADTIYYLPIAETEEEKLKIYQDYFMPLNNVVVIVYD